MSGDPLQHPAFSAGRNRFRALAEYVDDVALVVGLDGPILYVSPSAQRLLGYDPSGAIGTDVFQLIDEDDQRAMRASFGDLVAGRRLTVALELRAITADGSSIDVEVVASAPTESAGGVVVNVRDVTERKRIEREALEVQTRYATIMESLVDGIMMVDEIGRAHV